MGYYKDEHMIITCYKKEPLLELRNLILDWIVEAFEDADLPDYSKYISGDLRNLANPDYFLFIPADGSKEGWTTSNAMDEVREKIRTYIIKHNAKSDDKIQCLVVTDDDYLGFGVERMVQE